MRRDKFQVVNLWAYCRHPLLVARFYRAMGYLPSVGCPGTYNEKVLWRKIFDRNPLIATLSDKLLAKQYFSETCPDLKTPDVLWSGDRAEDIPDKVLRGNVVVKTNHGSGFNLFVKDGVFDRQSLNSTVQRWLHHYPYGRKTGEWGYAKIRPKVYVERMLCDARHAEPVQINFSTFAGRPIIAHVITGAVFGPKMAGIFDADGQRLSGTPLHFLSEDQQLPSGYELPACYLDAVQCASKLGNQLDYARIDFLTLGDQLFASEITFYTLGGYAAYTNPAIERLLSGAWDLRHSWFFNSPKPGWRRKYAHRLAVARSRQPMPSIDQ